MASMGIRMDEYRLPVSISCRLFASGSVSDHDVVVGVDDALRRTVSIALGIWMSGNANGFPALLSGVIIGRRSNGDANSLA